MLTVRDVSVARAGLSVVRGASLAARRGEVVVLLGLNGAGKTTLLEGISGVLPLAAGRVELDGERIDRWLPVRRARAGLAHVEEGRPVFPELTTEENLLVAVGDRVRAEEAFAQFPELEKRRGVRASMLSGGEQQMLVLARAWLREPKALLLDELSLGLAPAVVGRLMRSVRLLADAGAAILLVEQFAPLALQIGDRAAVLRSGELVFEGTTADLGDGDRLHERLFGEPAGVPVYGGHQ
jgi:branched-chain amino acid transport system ATP-binding protein